MRNLVKIGSVVALSAGLFFGLTTLTGGSVAQLLGSQSTVGNCSSVGGQSGVGGKSTVGGQSNVCKVPTKPFITNVPKKPVYHGGFVAVVYTNGDGSRYVTSGTPKVCGVASDHLTVGFVGVGTCRLTAHVAAGETYDSANGAPQWFDVTKATPTGPKIGNLPAKPVVGGTFTAHVVTDSPGATSVTSSTTAVCTVTAPLKVKFVAAGKCTLVAHVATTAYYLARTGVAQSVTVP